jgi:hypothetical protein
VIYINGDNLAFKSFDFEHTWWRLLQKRIVHNKLYINVFFYCTKLLWFLENILCLCKL